jgi:hypothetical protein
VLLALQLWHFALPVDQRARVVFAAGGALGLLGLLRPAWPLIRRLYRAVPLLGAGTLAAVWLSNRASEGSRFGDTGGYYVPAIRWVIEYPIVVGLANLYPPYAYNLTYFLYAALLDGGPFAGRTHHLLNSTLLAVLIARSLVGLWRVLRRRSVSSAGDLFYTLMLPAEAEAATGYLFTSPAPDFAVYMLGIALCGELVAVMTSPVPDRPTDADAAVVDDTAGTSATAGELRLHFLSLALLTALAPTVKLPILGLAAAAMLVGGVAWIRRTRGQRRTMFGGLALAAVIGALAIGPWVAGNVLLSGCPLFPSAIGALPVAWRVDWDVQQWIQSTMILGDWRVVLRDPHWVAQRFVALGWTEPSITVPAGITLASLACGGLAAIVRLLRRRPRQGVRLPAAAVLPPLASLIFCIETTPVPRYAGATMWLLAACAIMAAFGGRMLGPFARRAMALGAVALVALPFLTGAALWLDLRGFPPSPGAVVAAQRLASGLDVNVPGPANPSCWAAPLPCTPRPHPGLRLRRPPDLASGFEVEPGSGPPPPMTVPGLR